MRGQVLAEFPPVHLALDGGEHHLADREVGLPRSLPEAFEQILGTSNARLAMSLQGHDVRLMASAS